MEKRGNNGGLAGKGIFLAFLVLLVVLVEISFISSQSLEVSNNLFKVSVKQGESAVKNISVFSSDKGEVSIFSEGISKGVSFSNETIFFNQGESKIIQVFFNSSELEEGVYLGRVVLEGEEKEKIPFIFEVESVDLFFDSNLDVPPRYLEIEAGNDVVAQIKVFNIVSSGGLTARLGPIPVQLTYSIFNIQGDKIYSETEEVIVDNQAQMNKPIKISEKTGDGKYIIVVETVYKNSLGVSSATFEVMEKQEKNSSVSSLAGSNLIWVGGVFLIVLIFLIYIIYDRNSFLRELRKFHSDEMKHQRELLQTQVKVLQKKKKVSRKEIRRRVNAQVRQLKKKQKERTKKIEQLRKDGKVNDMKRQIQDWKKKGYSTLPLEYKVKGLSGGEMKKILSDWKAKYKN